MECLLKAKKKSIAGFTLLELVSVISLMGILAYSFVIKTFDYRKSNLTVAAKKIQSDLTYARSLALTKRGTAFGVEFTDSTDSYIVYESSTATPVRNPLTRKDMNEDFSDLTGITLTGGDYTVEFDRKGKPTLGGGGSIQVTDGASTKTIVVVTNTGRIHIQ